MPETPSQIGPYPVTGVVGREGGTSVYHATEPAHNRPVVVQLLSPRLLEEPKIFARFQRDAGALAKAPHPNVVQVLATGEDGGRPYLVTEAVAGAPLDEVLRGRKLNVAEAIAVMRGICRGLAHAHEHGVLHGHVWPHAVRVSPDLNAVKLADFGFTRAESLGMTGTLSTGALNLGAFRYLAPEQTETRPGAPAPDHRADLYSAGAVFYEMLTGRAPGERFALPSQVNSELPPETDVVVLKCLARNPTERYASAIDLLSGLSKLEEASRVRLLSELRGITRAGSGKKMILILAGVAVLIVVLVILVFLLKH
jgi:eukaryotic-like serine/threonine-protein kinase